MVTDSAIRRCTVHRLGIPLRTRVTHATSQREQAEPVVVAVEVGRGVVGYGETLPRPYVTGETVASVVEAIERVLLPQVIELHPKRFPDALEAIDALPERGESGEVITAARAAVELALLDAYARFFDRPIADVAGWMGLPNFGEPGSAGRVRYSGVLASDSLRLTRKMLNLLWWYGLRDFKLKVGLDDDKARLEMVLKRMVRAIERGKATMRIDANGAWTPEEAVDRLGMYWDRPIAGIEQPMCKGHEDGLPLIKDLCTAPIIHDESLVTMDDAQRLAELGVADGFNVRISKCGGLMPSLRLADFARKQDAVIQLGCMVGETSILSAAGRRFLEMTPGVSFAEGWFGRFLLREDVTTKALQFRYGGRGRALPGPGLGVQVDAGRLERLAVADALVYPF